LICPHGTIRIKAYDPKYIKKAPETFKCADAKGKDFAGMKFTIQVAPEDCTGCAACVVNCPAQEKDENKQPTGRHAINMVPQVPIRDSERKNYDYFLSIPNTDGKLFNSATVKGSQLIAPLFEYSGACSGCGETAYVKLVTQLFGDRTFIGNATGCSSIYGGNLPTTPYGQREDGRGPTWSNSLFEDAAEFAMGMRLTVNKFREYALELLTKVAESGCVDKTLADEIATTCRTNNPAQDAIEQQRQRVEELKAKCRQNHLADADKLFGVADYLVRKSVWGLGGDGWAYDIGYGGLDHVLASGVDINLLVLDTEVYSNTGGQMSKSTPIGAVAKFAAGGKPRPKKDLGMLAMTYGNIYVAKIAIGANPNQAVKAFVEAESYPGPSLIIAYAHCIAHGINMTNGYQEQQKAVNCGHWPLYRFDPRLKEQGKNPLQMDSKPPSIDLEEYIYGENRFRSLQKSKPEAAAQLLAYAKREVASRARLMQQLADLQCDRKQ
jgi:pyruvate-ferredoxin/flavodoxin oxidoreductase